MLDFISAIQNEGLTPPPDITPGIIHRFPGAGKNESNRAGYCLLFTDGLGGIFGDWSTGFTATWRSSETQSLTPHGWSLFNTSVERARREAQEQREAAQEEAAESAVTPYDYENELRADMIKRGHTPPMEIVVGKWCVYESSFWDSNPDGEMVLEKGVDDFVHVDPSGHCAVYGVVGDQTCCSWMSPAAHGHDLAPTVFDKLSDLQGNVYLEALRRESAGPEDDVEHWNYGPPAIRVEAGPPPPRPSDKQFRDAQPCSLPKPAPEPEPSVITPGEIENENMTFTIPPEVLAHPLIDLGMQAARELSGSKIEQYLFPTVVAHIATAIAGKVECQGIYPTFLKVVVGPSGSGKSASIKSLMKYVTPFFNLSIDRNDGKPAEITNPFYGWNGVASGPALYRALSVKPRGLYTFDEIGQNLLTGNRDANQSGIRAALLELVTANGARIEKAYSDLANNVKVENPAPNILGFTTPGIFRNFTADDITSGLIPRSDFFVYSGAAHYREASPNPKSESALEFVNRLKSLYSADKPKGRYNLIAGDAVSIAMEPDAESAMSEYSRQVVDAQNTESDDGRRGIIARRYECATKYALVFHAANEDIFAPLTLAEVVLGQRMADALTKWKLDVLLAELTSGEYHYLCSQFIEGIRAAIKAGKKATAKTIKDRRPRLKNVPPRLWGDLVTTMAQSREITVKIDTRGQEHYELVKP